MIGNILLGVFAAAMLGFFIWAAIKAAEGVIVGVGALLTAMVVGLTIQTSHDNTPVYFVGGKEAKILSQFETDRFSCFFYEADDGSYKEIRFDKYEDVMKIRDGAKLKINYYHGATFFGEDRRETRVEL